MEKGFVIVVALVFVFSLGFAAADEWDDFSDESGSDESGSDESGSGGGILEEPSLNSEGDPDSTSSPTESSASEDSFFKDSEGYNENFYYAWGVGIVGVLIILVIIFLLLKKPKNKF